MHFEVIGNAAERVLRLCEPGHLVPPGNAATEELLEAAGIHRARGLVVCAGGDVESVYIVLTAGGLRPDLNIVVRADDEESEAQLLRAGANRVIGFR